MFDVNTISGSAVIAKIAGTLSTAKMMSVASRKSRAMNSGVACHRPSILEEKAFPVESRASPA